VGEGVAVYGVHGQVVLYCKGYVSGVVIKVVDGRVILRSSGSMGGRCCVGVDYINSRRYCNCIVGDRNSMNDWGGGGSIPKHQPAHRSPTPKHQPLIQTLCILA